MSNRPQVYKCTKHWRITVYTLFFIRTSKFCRDSLFLIFWVLQPQFVLNLFLFLWACSLKWWEIKTKRQGIEKQCWSSVFWGDLCTFISNYRPLWIRVSFGTITDTIISENRCFCVFTVHIANVNYKISTLSIFFSLNLSLFLNCS